MNSKICYFSSAFPRQMEVILPKEDFIRINRSYIIRIDSIEMIDPGFEYIVINKNRVPDGLLEKGDKFRHRNHINIGRAYKQEVKKRLMQA